MEGKDNDLIDRLVKYLFAFHFITCIFFTFRIRSDPYFAPIHGAELDSLLDPATFIGRAPEQVREFIDEEVKPILDKYQGQLEGVANLKV